MIDDLETLTREEIYQQTINLIRSYAFPPKKKLGQHFVLDPFLVKTLIETANLSKEDQVLEIGGGLGTITQFIAPRVKRLTVIEKDPLLALILNREIASTFENVNILSDDAVTCVYPEFNVVIGNLPFEISTPLTLRLGRLQNPRFRRLSVTYQAEYAARITALPNTQNYGRITAMLSNFFHFEKIKTYPPKSFIPKPDVATSIVLGTPIQAPVETLLPGYEIFVSLIFNRKNRKVRKVLRAAVKKHPFFANISEKKITELENIELSNERVVNLSKEQILKLFKYFQNT